MKTFYQWDESCVAAVAVDCDEDGPLPERSMPTEPPATRVGRQVMWPGRWMQEPRPAPAALAYDVREGWPA
jgi:hypothetical protein